METGSTHQKPIHTTGKTQRSARAMAAIRAKQRQTHLWWRRNDSENKLTDSTENCFHQWWRSQTFACLAWHVASETWLLVVAYVEGMGTCTCSSVQVLTLSSEQCFHVDSWGVKENIDQGERQRSSARYYASWGVQVRLLQKDVWDMTTKYQKDWLSSIFLVICQWTAPCVLE